MSVPCGLWVVGVITRLHRQGHAVPLLAELSRSQLLRAWARKLLRREAQGVPRRGGVQGLLRRRVRTRRVRRRLR